MDFVHCLLSKIWSVNIVPRRLIQTLQVPISKVTRPNGPDEYRRITLCSAIYKVYSRFLLEQLEHYLGEVPNYQFAYHQNRSAEDQIFFVRQLLDERWRKGRLTFIVSLDIRQAFDTIDLAQVPLVLQRLGVPVYLINRIISACLTERTSLQWFGQRTAEFNKTRGIKQGCPLSPKLFVYLLHQALLRLQQLMPELFLGQTDRIRLPCLRVYADDILAVLTESSQIPRLISLLETCLSEFGLSLNVSKTEVLVRDPAYCDVRDPPSQCQFGPFNLKLVTKLKYLGAYITSSLNRRETVSDRVSKALRVYRSIADFSRRYRLCWKTIARIYHTVIAPIVLYGLKVTTLTKQSRDRLRDMEYKIVSGLFLLSRPVDDDDAASSNRTSERVDIDQVLDGRTIIRKVRVARLVYWAHLRRMDESSLLVMAADYHLPGPYKRGRPCFNWAHSVEEDMKCIGISEAYLQELAQDKVRFRTFLDNNFKAIFEEVPVDLESVQYEADFTGFDYDDNDHEELNFAGFQDEDPLPEVPYLSDPSDSELDFP